MQHEANPVDTERKLNVHKTFRRRPARLLNVLCTFNLRPVYTGIGDRMGYKKPLFLCLLIYAKLPIFMLERLV